MNKIFLLLIFSIFTLSVSAQNAPAVKADKLYKADNTVIDCKILEVSATTIKYKKVNYPDGPTYEINKSEIVTIQYANGDSEVLTKNNNNYNPGVAPAPSSPTPSASRPLSVRKPFAAGDPIFQEGANLFNFGIGVGSPYQGSGLSTSVPPISLSFEHGINDKWGIGGLIGYTSASGTINYSDGLGNSYSGKVTGTYFIVGVRGIYHYKTTDKYDIYGGAMLGYNAASVSVSGDDGSGQASGSGIIVGAFVGGRYFFAKNIGAFGELGYNIAYLSVGLTARF